MLTACGGSGADSTPAPERRAVLVNAGVDVTVAEGERVTLTGAASGGDGVYSFSWNVPDGVVIEHPDPSLPDASLTAPVVAQSTSYTLTLVAVDSEGAQGSKSVALTVTPINILPVANITANAVDNYAAKSYPVAAQITLDGSGSFDTDPQTDEADIAAYAWQQVAGDDLLRDVVVNESVLTFTAPIILSPATAEFMLTVTDQEGAQATDRVTLTFLGEQGTLPKVSAGKPLAVFSGEQMSLFGEVTSDAPNAAPFELTWQHDFAGELSIAEPTQLHTVAQAPLVQLATDIRFELIAIDVFDNTMASVVTYTVYPPQKSLINDTGLSVSADATSVESTYVSSFPGQDAQFGNDRIESSGLLNKTGRGENGFDFTRLNENGDPVDDLSQPWRCVRDNITGLVWETKNSAENDLHNADQKFTWYQEADNGNFEGAVNAASESCHVASGECNTSAFIAEVNQAGLCGFFDWRIPTHGELQSILHYGRSVSTLLDSEYFPFPTISPQPFLWYWTNQSSADGVSDSTARNAWAIDFATGVDNFLNKTTEQRVRLVRAGRSIL